MLPLHSHGFGLRILLIDPRFIHGYQTTKKKFSSNSVNVCLERLRCVSLWKRVRKHGTQRENTLNM